MHGYASLPTLVPVMDTIIGFLSVKERIKCKSVCRSWKKEIELRERKNKTLMLHFGPYPWNLRWSETNNRGLMKFENSFEVKSFTFLEHPLTRSLLEKTKKLAIVGFYRNIFNPEISNLQPHLGYFKQCEEIEIRSLKPEGTLTFDLPKLNVLVINDVRTNKLVLNCPSLEVLFSNRKVEEIDFQNAKKLKRLICFGWPARVSLDGKFESLEYLNLFTARDEPVNDRLLGLMPKMKRFVLYSTDLQADLKIIRTQQKRFNLKNLEILFFGFRNPVEIALDRDESGFVRIDGCVGQLFENYSKLVENSPWRVCIDYSKLFSKFKILPSNFLEHFNEPYLIEIREVTNYTHLFEFLKCYPFLQQLKIHFSKVKTDRILDLVHLLQPSLLELTIVEERPSNFLEIDLSFLRLLNLVHLNLESFGLPVEFVRKVSARRGTHFNGLLFRELRSGHLMVIYFRSLDPLLVDFSCGQKRLQCSSVEQLITGMQSDPHLSTLLL